MNKEEQFEQSGAFEKVNELLSENGLGCEGEEQFVEDSLLGKVDSLSEMQVEEEDGKLVYSVETEEDETRHLYVLVLFEGGGITKVKVDIGTVAGPLAGSGYSWELTPEGEVIFGSRWIS